MRTSCEYRPVQRTRRNSPFLEGYDVVICGKYTISCFGGSFDGVGNVVMFAAVELKGLDGKVEFFEFE